MYIMEIKCKKNLVNQSGHQDFTKDKIYTAEGNEINEKTRVLSDDENMPHVLGLWHKHFKKVK